MARMKNWSLVICASLVCLAVPFGTGAASQPNILFIMSDDHAAHAISAYGSRVNQTPNLDRLASGGMKFNNCFASASSSGAVSCMLNVEC